MEFVAIDFETCNQSRDSAVSIGLVKMNEKGEVVDQYYSLIYPFQPIFDPLCMSVNGLNRNDILLSCRLNELWPEIDAFIGSLPLVAHNAAFDMRVLQMSLACYGIRVPSYEYYCTYQISRKILLGYNSYSLTYIVPKLLNRTYNAHNALDDAYVCGLLFSYILQREHIDSKEELDDYLKYKKSNYPKVLS